MSMTKEELIRCIESIAPKELMEDWDNTGIQLDVGHREINRVLVCLDICSETIEEAIQEDCEFIVSHHPMIFAPIRCVSREDAVGRYLIKLIRNNISVYAAHTSFDSCVGGNNDYLAELIGLADIKTPEQAPVMRTGILMRPVTLRQFCELADRKITGGKGLRYSGDDEKMIRTVGICTGAGADLLDGAAKLGCDVLVTGDVKYHDAQRALQLGIALIDAGHYGTEIYFNKNMAEKLQAAAGGRVRVIPSASQENWLKEIPANG